MQFTAIAFAALAATVSAQAPTYDVTKFTAGCVPHSVMCNYEFTVVASNADFPTTCKLMLQGDSSLLPTVDLTGCDNSAYSWSVAKADSGLTLSITTNINSRSNLTGTHALTADQLEIQQSGASSSQVYTGPQEFQLQSTGVSI